MTFCNSALAAAASVGSRPFSVMSVPACSEFAFIVAACVPHLVDSLHALHERRELLELRPLVIDRAYRSKHVHRPFDTRHDILLVFLGRLIRYPALASMKQSRLLRVLSGKASIRRREGG